MPSSVACVSASARGRDECSSCGVTAAREDGVGRELRVRRIDRQQLRAAAHELGRAAFVDVDVRHRVADDRVGVAADRGERERIGRGAVEHEEDVALGLEHAPRSRRSRRASSRRRRSPARGRCSPLERAPCLGTDARVVVARELRAATLRRVSRRCVAAMRFASRAARRSRTLDRRSPTQRATDCSACGSAAGFVPPACAMSGAAAALAADLLRDVVDELARLHLAGEVARHAGDQRHLAVGDAREHDRGATSACPSACPSSRAAPSTSAAVERRRDDLRALDVDRAAGEIVAGARRRLRLEPRELALRARARSPAAARCAPRARAIGAFSSCAAPASFASCCCTYASAPLPVTASMRRMPAATPLSPTILNKPMSPVRETCVPPQSSRERADVEHAHLVAVFLAEQHHRARLLRFGDRHRARGDALRCRGSPR